MLLPIYQALFSRINYKFSTSEHGRLTSLYFEDVNRVQGRWRREHRDGPLLIYQGQSSRLFVQDADVFNKEEFERLLKTIRITGNAVLPKYYSQRPVDGWHVIEVVPKSIRSYQIGHSSGGTVILNDPTANAGLDSLVHYAGDVSDWTQMS